jgi:phospholipase C
LEDIMLNAVQHIIVRMLENRSFDHMLGLLYADRECREAWPQYARRADERPSRIASGMFFPTGSSAR